jgi:hypothetical protein
VAQCEREEDLGQERVTSDFNAATAIFRVGRSVQTSLDGVSNFGWSEYRTIRIRNTTDYLLMTAAVRVGYTSSSTCPTFLDTSSATTVLFREPLLPGSSVERSEVYISYPNNGNTPNRRLCVTLLAADFQEPSFTRRSCD